MARATYPQGVAQDRMSSHKIPAFRLDGQAVVVAVLLGAAATALLQIGERVDTRLFGGMVVPFGILCLSTMGLIAAFLYGPVAAILTVEINPFISVMTSTGPLSWFWFVNNFLYVIPAGYVMVKLQPMDRWWKWSLASFAGALPAFLTLIPIQILVNGLPAGTALGICAIHIAWEAIGPATAAMLICRAIVRSGIAK